MWQKIYTTEQAEKTYWIHLQESLLLTQVGPGRRLAGFDEQVLITNQLLVF